MVNSVSREAAEKVALDALGWLAGSPDYFGQFLGVSGTDATGVKERLSEPDFLGFVLDFIMSNEFMAQEFCQDFSLSPEAFQSARHSLPGGEAVHWT